MKRINIPKNLPSVRKRNMMLIHNHFPRILDGLASGERSFEGLAADITHLEGMWDGVKGSKGEERASAIRSARAKQGGLAREMQALFGHLVEGMPARPKDKKTFKNRAADIKDDLRSRLAEAKQPEAELIERPYGDAEKEADNEVGRGREGFFPGAFIEKSHLKGAVRNVERSVDKPTENVKFEKAVVRELQKRPEYADETIPPRLLQDHAMHHGIGIPYPNPKKVRTYIPGLEVGGGALWKEPKKAKGKGDRRTAASARYNG